MATLYEYPFLTITGIAVIIGYLLVIRSNLAKLPIRPQFEVGFSQSIGDRELQSDYVSVEYSKNGCIAVAVDGQGRGKTGKVCGEITIKTIIQNYINAGNSFNSAYFFSSAISDANRRVANYLNGEPGGASIAIVVIEDNRLYYAAVGNTTAAVYRNHDLVILNDGHTGGRLAEEEYRRGYLSREEALVKIRSIKAYNFIGMDRECRIETGDYPIDIKRDDIITVMTDGVYRGAGHGYAERVFGINTTCQDMADKITSNTDMRESEDRDNSSIVIIRV